MHFAMQPVHQLARGLRDHGPQLFAGLDEPHDELMSLVWGPRFDRGHAMGLVARQPDVAASLLPAVLDAADRFDRLHGQAQARLRRMILRHRALASADAGPPM
jgi:hypothetical protein